MLKFDIFRKKINEMSSGGAGGGIANVAGSGAIAGLGVGSQGEPGVSSKDQPRAAKIVLGKFRRKKPNLIGGKITEETEHGHNPVKVNVYHGSGHHFSEFSQKHAKLPNDHMGGGIGYFTDNHDMAKSYAKARSKDSKTHTPYVYHTNLKMHNVFDVDHNFHGKKLKHILPDEKHHEHFARGAGLLSAGSDKFRVLAKLKTGDINLTGHQVWKGLSHGNVDTTKARDHLVKKGYDGLRYNGGENIGGATKHNVYIPYNKDSIHINKTEKITSNKLNEVFSKIQSYKWTVHGPEVHQAEFSVKKDDKIRVTFKKLDFSKNDWEVDFARSNIDTKHDFTTARLSTGFSYEIFSTVFEIIKDFVKDARPYSLWITGIEKGWKRDSRTKLYDTMTKLLPQKIGYKLTHRQDLGGSVVWVLEPKQKLTEETFAGHKVFKVKSEYYHRCRMGKRKFLRYEKYVGNDEFGEEIRKYGRKNYNTAIIVQDESTGAMVYLRRERKL